MERMKNEMWPEDDEAKRRRCHEAGVEFENHCCLDMAFAISEPIFTAHQGPNRVIDWIASWDEYRIPMPYDGYASTLILHCPWCGASLSPSRRDEWYRTLWGMGYDDPGNQDLPPAFETDRWWRSREPERDAPGTDDSPR